MARVLHNLKLELDQDLSEHLQWLVPGHGDFRILRQSVDARQRHNPHFVMSVEVAEPGEILADATISLDKAEGCQGERPIVVGSGPAGLFAALRLVERGVKCLLLERGSMAEERIKGINRFWRYGELDPRNNVCFGEGGAGLYSDGKLITRIRSPHIPYVMDRLVRFGAPAEIRWLSNPHVGSDRIRRVIPNIRRFLRDHGCDIRFDTQVTELITEGRQVVGVRTATGETWRSPAVLLATGHSAEDILHHLRDQGVFLEGKSFAVGLRIEHPQTVINRIQYRDHWAHPKLGSANYKLTHHDPERGIDVYSFCMCPGGYVLSSGTAPDGIVCNGMSNYRRNSPYANAAVVVAIDHAMNFAGDVFGGLTFRRELENRAYVSVRDAGGSKELPAQKVVDFLAGQSSKILAAGSSPSGAVSTRLDRLLPAAVTHKLREGILNFEKAMKGFIGPDAQLYGVESRTSCPVRITRDENTLQSVSHPGLFPVGEGAGYAGGITSAACDGIRSAEKVMEFLGALQGARPET